MNDLAHLSLSNRQRARKIILIVEDDECVGELLALAITQESDYQPLVARSGTQAFEVISEIKPDLLLIDYFLRCENGLNLYDKILSIYGFEAMPAIFLTTGEEHLRLILEQRHLAVLEKPFDLDNLLLAIETHIDLLCTVRCSLS